MTPIVVLLFGPVAVEAERSEVWVVLHNLLNGPLFGVKADTESSDLLTSSGGLKIALIRIGHKIPTVGTQRCAMGSELLQGGNRQWIGACNVAVLQPGHHKWQHIRGARHG